jgi:bifunctional non-homologous end joining protein LigD
LVAGKPGIQFNGHQTGDGELILKHGGQLGLEGVVSKTIDAPYAPGNRGLWRKAKALNRQEFVVVGLSILEDRDHISARFCLAFITDTASSSTPIESGQGCRTKVLADLRRRLEPLSRTESPLSVPPPGKTRFGSPLVAAHGLCWAEGGQAAEQVRRER